MRPPERPDGRLVDDGRLYERPLCERWYLPGFAARWLDRDAEIWPARDGDVV
jgi:hypothetical protein